MGKAVLPIKLDNLRSGFWGPWEARCEFNIDPLNLGRIKVRCAPIHGPADVDLVDINASHSPNGGSPDPLDQFHGTTIIKENLPWAVPCFPFFGAFDVPPVGEWIWVFFKNGDPAYPVYFGYWPKTGQAKLQTFGLVLPGTELGLSGGLAGWSGVLPPGAENIAPGSVQYLPGVYDRIFEEAGKKYGIDPKLLKALSISESHLDPNIVNDKSVGLMQVNTAAHPEFTVDELKDPATNIDAGARILSEDLYKTHGDLNEALANYKGFEKYGIGPSVVRVNTVYSYFNALRAIGGADAAFYDREWKNIRAVYGEGSNPTSDPLVDANREIENQNEQLVRQRGGVWTYDKWAPNFRPVGRRASVSIPAGQNFTEIPADLFMTSASPETLDHPAADPTVRVVYRSPMGHAIVAGERLQNEYLKFVDVTGAVLELNNPLKRTVNFDYSGRRDTAGTISDLAATLSSDPTVLHRLLAKMFGLQTFTRLVGQLNQNLDLATDGTSAAVSLAGLAGQLMMQINHLVQDSPGGNLAWLEGVAQTCNIVLSGTNGMQLSLVKTADPQAPAPFVGIPSPDLTAISLVDGKGNGLILKSVVGGDGSQNQSSTVLNAFQAAFTIQRNQDQSELISALLSDGAKITVSKSDNGLSEIEASVPSTGKIRLSGPGGAEIRIDQGNIFLIPGSGGQVLIGTNPSQKIARVNDTVEVQNVQSGTDTVIGTIITGADETRA